MEWIGWERILFASDYPHWISTIRGSPSLLHPEEHRAAIYGGNAMRLFGRT